MATIAWYVSGHGFGHASRDIEVLNELGRQRPDIAVTIRTPAPRWIFDLTLTRPVDWRPRESDTGVVQLDSLRLDAARRSAGGSLSRDTRLGGRERGGVASRGRRHARRRRHSAAGVRGGGARGIPSVALGNFTWDWIYDGYREPVCRGGARADDTRGILHAALALRLPMAGGFDMFARVERSAFIARHARGGRPTSGDSSSCPTTSRSCSSRSAATACRRST